VYALDWIGGVNDFSGGWSYSKKAERLSQLSIYDLQLSGYFLPHFSSNSSSLPYPFCSLLA